MLFFSLLMWSAICSSVNGLGGHGAKRSQVEKDKYCMISLTCGIFKKYNKLVNVTKKKQTHRYKGLPVFTSGESKEGTDNRELGGYKYKLLGIK